jgi:hypothetical protein
VYASARLTPHSGPFPASAAHHAAAHPAQGVATARAAAPAAPQGVVLTAPLGVATTAAHQCAGAHPHQRALVAGKLGLYGRSSRPLCRGWSVQSLTHCCSGIAPFGSAYWNLLVLTPGLACASCACLGLFNAWSDGVRYCQQASVCLSAVCRRADSPPPRDSPPASPANRRGGSPAPARGRDMSGSPRRGRSGSR